MMNDLLLLPFFAFVQPLEAPPIIHHAHIHKPIAHSTHHRLSSGCHLASWYSPSDSSNRTANGERFTGRDLTAASRDLPFNTRLRVTYPRTGRVVVVRVNDRGPALSTGRDLDLSKAAAISLGLFSVGADAVCWTVL